ncbi:sodium:proton antiporter [Streptococcus pluranimalium]|uniref:cation:proton antiporter n=1 Tax=Streptococcus pluranimalium TaxID=82348 RepID=UPI002930C2B6|nr:sodium:proton antiporter [Streptococcus pluranimalium]
MDMPILVIIFLFSLIISNVINRVFPKIPLPLVQLLLGIAYGVFQGGKGIDLNPELFMAFVIAPLNFREGEEADVGSFLRYRSLILFLILPVVFVTALGIGAVASYLLPIELPMAAYFALGAALGPTDAVAFISIAKRFAFPKRVENVLKLEGLLNDASGLVAFQFAVTALLTGYFSIGQASVKLLLSIIGGFGIGFLFAFLNRVFLSVLEKFDAADVTGALLLELALPMVSYFVADTLGVSAIIAVVIAGVMQAGRLRKVTLFDAQVYRVTNVIWKTINFMLNGVVFLIFGSELTSILVPVLTSPDYGNGYLLSLLLVLTGLLFLLRFSMIGLYYAWLKWSKRKTLRKSWKEICLLTFSGVKGTVSIATILLLPRMENLQYSLLLFMVAGVTLLSFLTGLLILPFLAPAIDKPVDNFMRISILTKVLTILEQDSKDNPDNASLYAVIDNYNARIQGLILEQEPASVKRDLASLQLFMIDIESQGLEYAYNQEDIDLKEYRIYQGYLKILEKQVNRSFVSSFTYGIRIFMRVVRASLHEIVTFGARFRALKKVPKQHRRLTEQNRDRITNLYLKNTELILEALEDLEGYYNHPLVDYLQNARLRDAELIKSGLFVERVIMHWIPNSNDDILRGYYLERKTIAEFEADGLISNQYAQELRSNVNELENYSLNDTTTSLSYEFLNFASQK